MFSNISPLFYALVATLCFSYSSTIFTEFARKISPFWMNSFKAFIALFAFWITVFFMDNWIPINIKSIFALLSSGCIGLMIADIFMLHAMKDLGAARMLMIFGLQPFFLGLGSYFLFNQSFSLLNFLGVLLMLCCLYTISLESYKKNGSWQLRGMLFGLVAIFLDGIGVLLTRYGFDQTETISSAQVNAVRCVGAILGFVIINYFIHKKKERLSFIPTWKKLTKNEKYRIILGSLGGTYFSLMLYLTAVSKGQLSVISSVTITGPMFAAFFECIKSKRWPSTYLFIAFIFFISGFLVFTQQ
ncbi:MAG: DMT family transporter [Bacteriovoracaceae bacterium]|nr:DMT family transporter [Bacteriovoracaceae bacterium]